MYISTVYCYYQLGLVVFSQHALDPRQTQRSVQKSFRSCLLHYNTNGHKGYMYMRFFFYPIFVILLLTEVYYCTYIL